MPRGRRRQNLVGGLFTSRRKYAEDICDLFTTLLLRVCAAHAAVAGVFSLRPAAAVRALQELVDPSYVIQASYAGVTYPVPYVILAPLCPLELFSRRCWFPLQVLASIFSVTATFSRPAS